MEGLDVGSSPFVLTGHVEDVDGTPLAGARVSLTSAPGPVPDVALLTDVSGGFTLGVPGPGRYAVVAVRDDGAAGHAEVVVPALAGVEAGQPAAVVVRISGKPGGAGGTQPSG